MKIVSYNEFIKMPIGTIYSFYEPCYFSEFCIKHESIFHESGGSDWFYSELFGNPDYGEDQFIDVCQQMEGGESTECDFDGISRDGLFDYDRQFAIYESKDIRKLINALTETIDEL